MALGWNRAISYFRMKRYKLIPVIAFTLIAYSHCSAQLSRKEMISYYKKIFIYRCTQPFEIDKGYRDEVCTYSFDWMDKGSLLQIDSMSRVVSEEIRLDVQIINEDSSGDFYHSRMCVLHFCLNQYETGDMDKMAKGFARRMKNVNPFDYHLY